MSCAELNARRFIEAVPTAELEPITADYVQADEADMGLTYEEVRQHQPAAVHVDLGS